MRGQMPTPPDLRQRLREHHRELTGLLSILERGSPAWHDCERAIMATGRLYGTLFKEAIRPVHSQPPYRGG